MNSNIEYKIVERRDIAERDVYKEVNLFLSENQDVDGIYKIQIDELLSFIRRAHGIFDSETEDISEF